MTVPKVEDKDHQPGQAAGVETGQLEQQRDFVKKLQKKSLAKGDQWYLLENKWFKQWKKYVGFDTWETQNVGEPTANPGPIDNSALLKDINDPEELREHLIDELDYSLMPEEAWEKLVEWYGIVANQKPVVRTVVDYGMFLKNLKVEIYKMELKMCLHPNIEELKISRFSKVATLEEVEKVACSLFSVPKDANTRLWYRFSTNTLEMITDKSKTIQDESLYSAQVVLLEVQNADGTWPRSTPSGPASSGSRLALSYAGAVTSPTGGAQQNNASGSSSSGNTSASASASSATAGGSYRNTRSASAGLCGLINLGNTCFMNSALQCMSNTPPLTDYFTADRHLGDLNRDNPLGMHGEIAVAYAEMIKALWSGCTQAYPPRAFKEKVGRFAPQFHGYMQQDCQELMSFLLDGLHEDLNRVKDKPYIEAKNTDGRADHVLAKEAWANYLKRNDSIVTDTFHGLLKSTLVCPECSHISVTFDPSCFLSLPLPHRKDKLINAVVFTNEPGKPFKLRVHVPVYPSKCTGNDFYSIVSKITQLPAENLVAANMDLFDKRVKWIIEPNDEEIDDVVDTIYIYELPTSPWTNEGSLIRVYTREIVNRGSGELAFSTAAMFGVPFYLYSPTKHVSVDDLYEMALGWLRGRYVHMENASGDASQSRGEHEPMDEESATEDQGLDKENGPQNAANCVNEGQASETATSSGTSCRRKKRLFKVNLVNEMCNTSLNQQAKASNGEVLQGAATARDPNETANGGEDTLMLTPKAYLALDWLPQYKQAVYEEGPVVTMHSSYVNSGPASKRPVRLWECLKLFTTTEKLGAEDLWYCPACKTHQQATKKFDLWSLPKVLIIHLKRFSYNRYFRDKIDTLVDFPITGLQMESVVLDPKHSNATYDLIGVANHYGGMGGGHYTAYAKNKLTNTWHHFDDATVSPISESNLVSKNAYVLFYMRQDPPSTRTRNGADQTNSAISPTPNPSRPQRRLVAHMNSSTSESEESMSSNEESDDMDYEA